MFYVVHRECKMTNRNCEKGGWFTRVRYRVVTCGTTRKTTSKVVFFLFSGKAAPEGVASVTMNTATFGKMILCCKISRYWSRCLLKGL